MTDGTHQDKKRGTPFPDPMDVSFTNYMDDASEAAVRRRTDDFADTHGRRPRLLVAGAGQAGQTRDDRWIAAFLAQLGFDVDITSPRQAPESVVRTAVENDVHAICIPRMGDDFAGQAAAVLAVLKRDAIDDIRVLAAGRMRSGDLDGLPVPGISAVIDFSRDGLVDGVMAAVRCLART